MRTITEEKVWAIAYRPKWKKKRINPLNGIIAYYHPTIFGQEAPSKNGQYYQALGSFYCSRNYVLVCPDFVGFNDNEYVHPYVLYP